MDVVGFVFVRVRVCVVTRPVILCNMVMEQAIIFSPSTVSSCSLRNVYTGHYWSRVRVEVDAVTRLSAIACFRRKTRFKLSPLLLVYT